MEKLKRSSKRVIATLLIVVLLICSAPLDGFVGLEIDWSEFTLSAKAVSPITVEDTTYGVLDPDVSAKKITLNDDFYFVSHEIDYANWTSYDQYGEGYAIVAEYGVTGYYLIGINGLVKSFASNEVPKLTLLEEYSQDFPYAIYRVYNPDTQKYDVYNASNGQYYEYGLDDVILGTDTWALRQSDYCKSLTVIEKDGKFGIMDNKGRILYTPVFDNIGGYQNCMIGYIEQEYTDEYGFTGYEYSYAILANDGSTSQTKLYDNFLYDACNASVAIGEREADCVVFAVSLKGQKWAVLSTEKLTALTDYKYNSCERIKYEGHYYVIGEYTKTYTDNGDEIECGRQDIIRDDGNMWNVCNKFQGIYSSCTAYKNMLKICVGTDFHYDDPYGFNRIWDNTYYLITPDGKSIYYVDDEKSEKWSNFGGLYGDIELQYLLDDNRYKEICCFVNCEDEIIAKNVLESSIEWIEDYLIFCTYKNRETKYFIYNTATNEFIFEDFYMHEHNSNVVCISETEDSKKFGLFNLMTGEFSGYIFETNVSKKIYSCYITEFSGGDRKLWEVYFIKNGGDVTYYINDKFEKIDIVPNEFEVFGSNLLVDIDENDGNKKIIDFDGNLISKFNTLLRNNYGSEVLEAYPTINTETKKTGLINWDGSIILDNELENVGTTRNGLTYVEIDMGSISWNVGLSSVVDKYGNALIYGKYDNYCISDFGNHPYNDVGKSSFISLKNGNSVYIYDFSKCAGDFGEVDSSVVTEDDLFGEYSSYLDNGFYSSMCGILENDIVKAVSQHGHSSQVVAFAKSALKGNTGYVIGKLWNMLPFTSSDESKLQEELALEYLKQMDSELLEELISEISDAHGLVKKINTVQDEIKNFDSEKSKLRYVQVWKSKLFSENQLYDVITVVGNNQYKLDRFLSETGRAISVVEFVTTFLTICTIQDGIVEKLMQLIPKNTDLYVGLERINKQQKDGSYLIGVLLSDILTDEGLGYISSIIEKGVLKLATGKYASLVAIALDLGCEIVASMIDSPTLEKIEKSAFALANICTLKKAIDSYRDTIKKNYEQDGSLDVEEMKSNYSLLYGTYLQSLFTGLECAKDISESDGEIANITRHIDEYDGRLIYRSYIKTCLLNARTNWEYTVTANKAVLNKLLAEYPIGEGRVPIMYLMENFSDNDFVNHNTIEYCIDIPKDIGGYEVAGIASGTFDSESKLSGVYIPNTVESIEKGAFTSCQNLSTVYLGDNVQTIGEQAFYNCTGLSYINIPDSVTNINNNSFSEVEDLVIESSNDEVLLNFENSDNITTQSRDKEIVGIEIITEPVSKTVEMQAEIDTTGLTLSVMYKDGTSKTVEDGFYCEIAERKLGENTVFVSYDGFTTEYIVKITESECSYSIKYEDECGKEIAPSITGSALAGSELTLTIPDIDGYLPYDSQIIKIIGYKNDFVVQYKKESKKSIKDCSVFINDQYYNKQYLTPTAEVTLSNITLQENVDYLLKYDNNRNIGTASVIIIGIGSYKDIVEANFEIAELVHSFINYTYDNNATCAADGTKTAYCDNGCGEKNTIVDVGSKVAHKEVNLNAVAATCTTTGKTTGKKCSVCGTITVPQIAIAKLTHTLDNGAVTKKATYTSTGTKTYKCTVCKATLKTETIAKLILGKVSSLKAKKVKVTKSSEITLTWNKVGNGIKYEIYQQNGKSWKKIKTTSSTNYTVKKLSANKSYKFRVRAIVDGASGAYSSVLTVKTVPATTSKLTLKAGSKQLTASWKSVSDISGYEVQYSTSSKMKNAKTVKVKKSSKKTTIKKLTKGKKYYVRVRAYTTVNGKKVYSSWSTVKNVKVK